MYFSFSLTGRIWSHLSYPDLSIVCLYTLELISKYSTWGEPHELAHSHSSHSTHFNHSGFGAFPHCGHFLWDSLPVDIRAAPSLETFMARFRPCVKKRCAWVLFLWHYLDKMSVLLLYISIAPLVFITFCLTICDDTSAFLKNQEKHSEMAAFNLSSLGTIGEKTLAHKTHLCSLSNNI